MHQRKHGEGRKKIFLVHEIVVDFSKLIYQREVKQMKIIQLHEEDWVRAYPVMSELRTHLSLEEYLELLKEMAPQGYKMYAIEMEGEIVALTGIIQLTNLYHFKHIYVYDLITKASERSKGYGDHLLAYIHELAKQEDCQTVTLTSGLQRTNAHRFYEEKMGYDKKSYAFSYEVNKNR